MRRLTSAFTLENLRGFARDERAATAIEYAIIAGTISIAIVATVRSIGTSLNGTFESVKNGFPT
jgi:pilus assembly protein Flp/PilA